ncbi:glycosyltransferase family 2 protein [Sphingomonas sp. MMS24-J13]|uniref:glycosyltransferase family 2 protein n=1 Tax=Sphingomonas sp. MMS24-J13 TaxID=3238686 RepID=UPI00384BB6E2
MIGLILFLICMPLIVIDCVFLAEVTLGLAKEKGARPAPIDASRIALIIPAHNEESGVRAAVAAILAVIPPAVRVLLVAHNCSDRTAEEARAAGAEVTVLDRPDQRGKGYALAHGRAVLTADPPAVAILIDADCVPEPGTIEQIAATAHATGRAVQAAYLFGSRPVDAPMVQISNFALLVKNLVRQRGGRRLGAPALMTGSGMAFPWATFSTLDLATGNIVEDLAIGIELVRAGQPPLFDEGGLVWSTPSSEKGTQTQRSRWEGGFLATARTMALPLVGEGLRRGSWSLFWMGLHLLTPPLTLLLMANVALVAVLGVIAALGGPSTAFAVLAGLMALIVLAVLAAWAVAGRRVLSGRVLARLPLYMLWKIALYRKIIRKDEKPAWVRTERID